MFYYNKRTLIIYFEIYALAYNSNISKKIENLTLLVLLNKTRALQNIFENKKKPIKRRLRENLIGLLIFKVSKSSAYAVNFEILVFYYIIT